MFHEVDGGVDEKALAVRVLAGASVSLHQTAQHVAVERIGEVEDPRRLGTVDVDAVMRVERRPHGRVMRHREGRGEGGIGGEELVIFPPDVEEAIVVAVCAVAGRPLALLDDRLDRGLGAREVCDHHEAGQRGVGGPELRGGIADEQSPLAEMVGEHFEAVTNAAIEMPDRRVVLGARHQSSLGQGAVILGCRHELGYCRASPCPRAAPGR